LSEESFPSAIIEVCYGRITLPLSGISARIVSMNARFALRLRMDDSLWGCFIPGIRQIPGSRRKLSTCDRGELPMNRSSGFLRDVVAAGVLLVIPAATFAQNYVQTNLVSDTASRPTRMGRQQPSIRTSGTRGDRPAVRRHPGG
jgi:hypothetical protein